MENWNQLYKAANALEAHSVKGMLESEGIEVRLSGEGLGAAAGELPADVVEVTLWVAPAQLAAAKSFIEHYQTADRPEWYCQQCGEMNEGQFEICWQCGWENDAVDQ